MKIPNGAYENIVQATLSVQLPISGRRGSCTAGRTAECEAPAAAPPARRSSAGRAQLEQPRNAAQTAVPGQWTRAPSGGPACEKAAAPQLGPEQFIGSTRKRASRTLFAGKHDFPGRSHRLARQLAQRRLQIIKQSWSGKFTWVIILTVARVSRDAARIRFADAMTSFRTCRRK